jgi:hypothetical protein
MSDHLGDGRPENPERKRRAESAAMFQTSRYRAFRPGDDFKEKSRFDSEGAMARPVSKP